MYGEADFQQANRRVKRCCLCLGAALLPLAAAYVLGAVYDVYALMLVSLLAAFLCCVPACDFALLPALRYRRFLKEMQKGLRRSVECTLSHLVEGEQLQDGVRVRALHVTLCDGDSRIFYVNVSKLNLLAELGRRVHLVSYGRHVVECEEI